MAPCDIISIEPKACSGKCRSRPCASRPCIWVVAACEGMIARFEKPEGQAPALKPYDDGSVVVSLERFTHEIERAERAHGFSQLVIIGSGGDIAWVHSSLPEDVARHIAAEIQYPLLSSWFKQQDEAALTKAVGHVLSL